MSRTSNCAAASEQMGDQRNEGDQQQDVDETSCYVEREESAGPDDKKNDKQNHKHVVFSLKGTATRARTRDDVGRFVIGCDGLRGAR